MARRICSGRAIVTVRRTRRWSPVGRTGSHVKLRDEDSENPDDVRVDRHCHSAVPSTPATRQRRCQCAEEPIKYRAPHDRLADLVNGGELVRKRIGKRMINVLPGQTATAEARAGIGSQP